MHLATALLFVSFLASHSRFAGGNTNTNEKSITIKIAKCCELNELLLDDTCTPLSDTNETKPWQPEYTQDKDSNIYLKTPVTPDYRIGLPRCLSNEQQWHVYYYPSGPDRLAIILPSGKLRHYADNEEISEDNEEAGAFESIRIHDEEDQTKSIHYDYSFGQYCADKAILSSNNLVATYAMICVPEVSVQWTDTNFVMTHAIDPTFHGINIMIYLIVAIVYFALPQLRDLFGNMITSMALCLIVNQCARTVKLFSELGNHISFMVADTVAYTSLLAAFFWINAMGYYIWKTFSSRNVFLHTTDRKKYCYYSAYVWGATISSFALAIFAHFILETDKPTIGGTLYPAQETIANKMKRMRPYGRIHHKMKYNFRIFVYLFATMNISLITLLLTGLKYEAFVYLHIIANFLQACFIVYICICSQKRVKFLLGKTYNCCCNVDDNFEGFDWGEEMTAINAGY
ncbi:PREDICTED: probable G-protein coupled receptor Mth-like 5 isoform X2 [Polistes dominula]|uniref:Probable G-protein coupled receptor Mth-like 5 isoform X2 n=1 Tax=Polistes dominula TaxID=743375 RepID=A0ABM1ID69_POLDO|nr:PREDICTED: probable G-protein coupled receptor Mth-like 5 isoform X2 [Polistes dominula]